MAEMGNGFVLADWLLACLALFCALAHLAILRAPDLTESKIIEHIRWIKIGGFAILALRWGYVLSVHGDLFIPPATEIGLMLVLAAEFYRTVYRLFEHKMDIQYECRSQKRKKRGAT